MAEKKLIFADEFVKEIILSEIKILKLNKEKPLVLIPKEKNTEKRTKPFQTKPVQKQNYPQKNNFQTQQSYLQQSIPKQNSSPLQTPVYQQTVQQQYENPQQEVSGIDRIKFLLDDYTVSSIICDGTNKPLIVKRNEQSLATKLILTPEEINEIVQYFSDQSNIPIEEGAFRVIVRNFLFSSVISNLIGSRFIISRIVSTRPLR